MLFNASALRLYLRALLVRHQYFHVAALKVHGLHRLNTVNGLEETDRMLLQFGQFLSSHKRIWAFRLGHPASRWSPPMRNPSRPSCMTR